MDDNTKNDEIKKENDAMKGMQRDTGAGHNQGKRHGTAVKIVIPILIIMVVFGIWAYKNMLPDDGKVDEDVSEFALEATKDFDLETILSYGMPTMIDFGASYCAPCREMAPILVKVNKDYRGKAMIKYVDVEKNPQAAGEFGVSVVPTQFFFDDKGQPYGYHEGFLPEEEIIRVLGELGVK